MKYMGSKSRHKKELLPILLKNRKPGQYYVEPFCGSASVIEDVENPRIAIDNHPYLIEMFKALQNGWIPPEVVTEEDYRAIKESVKTPNSLYSPALVGFVGFACSYGGKWFGGYARGKDSKGNPRNYAAEGKRNILRQAPKLNGIDFYTADYTDTENILCLYNLHTGSNNGSIIYNDPPYANTTKYKSKFDHTKFWNWVRDIPTRNTVYVSEYSAPDDFECIWEKSVNNSLTKNTGGKQGIERLFIYRG